MNNPDAQIVASIETNYDILGTMNLPRQFTTHVNGLRVDLAGQARYLQRADHTITAIGEVGTAKTTTLCAITGLMLPGDSLRDRTVMLSGGGRTTPCAVELKQGDVPALTIQPETAEQLTLNVEWLVSSIVEKARAKTVVKLRMKGNDELPNETPADQSPPPEIARCIRGLCGIQSSAAFEKFVLETENVSKVILERIDHAEHTRLTYEGEPGGEARWLKEMFRKVCEGTAPGVPLPGHITLEVPSEISLGDYPVRYIDTRGINSPAARDDISQAIRDDRCAIMITCEWNSAPSAHILSILGRVKEEDPRLLRKVLIVVTHQGEQYTNTRDDFGEYTQSREEAYRIKCDQVIEALRTEGLEGVEVFAFDARVDDPGSLRSLLTTVLRRMRDDVVERARHTIEAVNDLPDAVKRLTGMFIDMAVALERHATPQFSAETAFRRAVEQINGEHPRRVWAMARGHGSYYNLSFYAELGEAIGRQSRSQTTQLVTGIIEMIRNKLADPGFEITYAYLQTLLDRIGRFQTEFLEAVRADARSIYVEMRDIADWGWDSYTYSGFRRYMVAEGLRKFSSSPRGALMHRQAQNAMQVAWRKHFIRPLQDSIRPTDQAA